MTAQKQLFCGLFAALLLVPMVAQASILTARPLHLIAHQAPVIATVTVVPSARPKAGSCAIPLTLKIQRVLKNVTKRKLKSAQELPYDGWDPACQAAEDARKGVSSLSGPDYFQPLVAGQSYLALLRPTKDGLWDYEASIHLVARPDGWIQAANWRGGGFQFPTTLPLFSSASGKTRVCTPASGAKACPFAVWFRLKDWELALNTPMRLHHYPALRAAERRKRASLR